MNLSELEATYRNYLSSRQLHGGRELRPSRFSLVKVKNSTNLPKLGAFPAPGASTAPAEKVAEDVAPLFLTGTGQRPVSVSIKLRTAFPMKHLVFICS